MRNFIKRFTSLLMVCLMISGITPNYVYAANNTAVSAIGTSSNDVSVEPVVAYPGVAAILKSGDTVTLKTATSDAQVYWIKYPIGSERPQQPFAWDGMKWIPNSESIVTITESCVIECYAEIGTRENQTDLSKVKRSVMSVFTYIVQEDGSAIGGVVSDYASGSVLSPGTYVRLTTSTKGATIFYQTYAPGKRPQEPIAWINSGMSDFGIQVNSDMIIEAFAETGVSGNTTDLSNNYRSATSLFSYTVSSQPNPSWSFLMNEDNYNFNNSAASFGYENGYSIPIERFETLWGKSSGLWNTFYWEIYNFYAKWGGSCYGFSGSSLRFNKGYMSESDYQYGAKNVYNFNIPRRKDSSITKLIELHQISQFLPSIQDELSKNGDNYQGLVDEMYASNGEGVLFCFWFSRGNQKYGHAVVAYDIKNLGNSIYLLSVYDNNYPDENLQIEVNVGRRTYAFKGTVYSGSTKYSYGTPENLSFVRTSVQNNVMANVAIAEKNNFTYVAVPSTNVVIKNSSGQIVSNMLRTTVSIPMNASHDIQMNQPVIWTLPVGSYTVELPNYTEAKAYQTVTFFDADSSITMKVCGTNIVLRGTSLGEGQIEVISGSVNTNKMEVNGAMKEITPIEISRAVSTITIEPTITAIPTPSKVFVNGQSVAFDAYNINGNNYFKLRDLAYALKGSKKQFEVGWDATKNAISLTSGKAYTSIGGEMASKGSVSKTPQVTTSKIYLDGKEVTLTAYNVDGNNYFKLRDIGAMFDFGVDWNGINNTIVINTSKNYTP